MNVLLFSNLSRNFVLYPLRPLSRTQGPAGVAGGLAAAKHPELGPAGWLLQNPTVACAGRMLSKVCGTVFSGKIVNLLKG